MAGEYYVNPFIRRGRYYYCVYKIMYFPFLPLSRGCQRTELVAIMKTQKLFLNACLSLVIYVLFPVNLLTIVLGNV
jgi:hypothetical protein